MNKSALIEIVAQSTGLKRKDAEAALNAAFSAIEADLATGGKVQLAGFGTFKVRENKARMGHNPKTKEPMEIAASKTAVFTAGKSLKEALNK